MQTVDEKPETIHLYVVREEEPRPPFHPIVLSLIALSLVAVVSIAFPYRQPEQEAIIRVPAVFLPLKVFTTSIHIIPTGVKTYPATTAHGVLTITNGSIISQTLPKGMIIGSVVLDYAVFVPAGSANGYGYATASAHALVSGRVGNIPILGINQVEGSSIYIRNVTVFTGGRNSYSLKYETTQDRQIALNAARLILAAETAKIHEFLAFPWKQSSQEKNAILRLSWTCQYVTYHIPSYMHVTHITLNGKNLLIDVVFVPRPRIIVFK